MKAPRWAVELGEHFANEPVIFGCAIVFLFMLSLGSCQFSCAAHADTIVQGHLPTQQGDCFATGDSLRQLDSVAVWWKAWDRPDSVLAFKAFVPRMQGSLISASLPTNSQAEVWMVAHNPLGWSCAQRITVNAGVSVPWQRRTVRPGVAYDVRGAVADTTLPGVYFTTRGGRIVRMVVVR